jgi:hypothetical protein
MLSIATLQLELVVFSMACRDFTKHRMFWTILGYIAYSSKLHLFREEELERDYTIEDGKIENEK